MKALDAAVNLWREPLLSNVESPTPAPRGSSGSPRLPAAPSVPITQLSPLDRVSAQPMRAR